MLRFFQFAFVALLFLLPTSLQAATFVAFLQDDAVEAPATEAPEAPATEAPADPVASPSDIKVAPKEPMPMESGSADAAPAALPAEGVVVVDCQPCGVVSYPCPQPCPVVCPVVCEPACQPACPTTYQPKKRCRLFGRR